MAGLPEEIELPKAPEKSRARLPYLTFRVPGNMLSESRERVIVNEMETQQQVLKTLKEGQDKLRGQCVKELAAVNITYNPELRGGPTQSYGGLDDMYGELQTHLKEVAHALEVAISPKLDAAATRKEGLLKLIKRVNDGAGKEKWDLQRHNLGIRELKEEAERIQMAIYGLRGDGENTAEGDKGSEVGEDGEEDEGEEYEGNGGTKREEEREGQEDERDKVYDKEVNKRLKEEIDEGVEQQSGNGKYEEHEGLAELMRENEKEIANEDLKKDHEKDKLGERLSQEEILHPDLSREGSPDVKSQKKEVEGGINLSERRVRINDKADAPGESKESLKILKYEADLEKIKEKISAMEESRKKTQEQVNRLEGERKKLQTELKSLDKPDLNKIEEEKEERKRDRERQNELDEHHKRKVKLERLRKNLGYHRLYLGDRLRTGDDHYSKIEIEGELQEADDILGKIEQLENIFTTVLDSKEKLKEVQDFIEILNREKHIEGKIRQPSKGPQDSLSKLKGHLSSSSPVYKRLPDNHIRLLILWHAPAGHYPLICSLKTRPLEATDANSTRKIPYAALSYFWGPESPEACLYLLHDEDKHADPNKDNWGSTARHARRIAIRNNLFRALLRLRRSDKPVALWVDFLCINQEDTVEKTAQLREMVKIYRTAETVCIWLGEGDDEGRSDRAMEFIGTVRDFAMLDTYVEDKNRAAEWQGLSELMRDRWFSRRWVVQEIALAKRATVHCGSRSVRWLDFVDAVSILVSNQYRIKKLFDPKVWREGPETLGEVQSFGANILIEATSSLFLRAEDGTITKPIKSLEFLVTSLRTFDTSDQRDLIYSLIFIAYDTYRKPGGYKLKLIDYQQTVAQVYKDFISFCIDSANLSPGYPLDIICRPWAMPVRRKGSEAEPILPSWIAMLSNSEFGEPEQVYKGRKNGETLVGSAGQPRYKTSGDKKGIARFDPVLERNQVTSNEQDGSSPLCNGPVGFDPPSAFPWSLVVKGFKLAVIEKVSSAKNTSGLILQESLEMGGWRGIENSRDDVPDKIWRTLVANKGPKGQIPPTWYQRACLRCLEIADNFNGGDLNVGQLLQSGSGMMRTYLTRVRNTIWNRSFFTAKLTKQQNNGLSLLRTQTSDLPENSRRQSRTGTSKRLNRNMSYFDIKDVYGNGKDDGKAPYSIELFGLCPGDTQSGDFLCIIYGCSVPVVLRLTAPGPLNKRFSIVGEAYVHGMMDGEAIDSYEAGWALGTEEEFNLM